MNDDEVAEYLHRNPGFFRERPAVLLDLLLPDPHTGSAVSLLERQTSMLRERVKALELRLAELMRIGRDNDALARQLDEWTKALLSAPAGAPLEAVAREALRQVFAVPLVAVIRWGEAPTGPLAVAARMAATLAGPRCGAGLDLRGLEGVLDPDWRAAASAALVPLRRTGEPAAFGLIVLGSPDASRFDAALGTAVLGRLGELAGAALGDAT